MIVCLINESAVGLKMKVTISCACVLVHILGESYFVDIYIYFILVFFLNQAILANRPWSILQPIILFIFFKLIIMYMFFNLIIMYLYIF